MPRKCAELALLIIIVVVIFMFLVTRRIIQLCPF
jgi:hypothetical protein